MGHPYANSTTTFNESPIFCERPVVVSMRYTFETPTTTTVIVTRTGSSGYPLTP